jgi:hypothetical protein
MGICHNVQSCALSLSSDFGAVFNQQSSNSTTLHAGINKQSVQFGFSIRPTLHGCKPHDCPPSIPKRTLHLWRMTDDSLDVILALMKQLESTLLGLKRSGLFCWPSASLEGSGLPQQLLRRLD